MKTFARLVPMAALIGIAALALSGCYGWGPHHGGWNGGHHRGSYYDDDWRGRGPGAPRQEPRCDSDPETPAPDCPDQ